LVNGVNVLKGVNVANAVKLEPTASAVAIESSSSWRVREEASAPGAAGEALQSGGFMAASGRVRLDRTTAGDAKGRLINRLVVVTARARRPGLGNGFRIMARIQDNLKGDRL